MSESEYTDLLKALAGKRMLPILKVWLSAIPARVFETFGWHRKSVNPVLIEISNICFDNKDMGMLIQTMNEKMFEYVPYSIEFEIYKYVLEDLKAELMKMAMDL